MKALLVGMVAVMFVGALLTPPAPRGAAVIPSGARENAQTDQPLRGASDSSPLDGGSVTDGRTADIPAVPSGAPQNPAMLEWQIHSDIGPLPTPGNRGPVTQDPRRPATTAPDPSRTPYTPRKPQNRVIRRPAATARPVTATGPELRGGASYYGTGGPGKYAAMGRYRDGSRVVAVVTAFHDGRTWSVTVPVVTQCGACRWEAGATLIDLSIPAWLDLGYPLSKGIAPVQVTIVEGEPW